MILPAVTAVRSSAVYVSPHARAARAPATSPSGRFSSPTSTSAYATISPTTVRTCLRRQRPKRIERVAIAAGAARRRRGVVRHTAVSRRVGHESAYPIGRLDTVSGGRYDYFCLGIMNIP